MRVTPPQGCHLKLRVHLCHLLGRLPACPGPSHARLRRGISIGSSNCTPNLHTQSFCCPLSWPQSGLSLSTVNSVSLASVLR